MAEDPIQIFEESDTGFDLDKWYGKVREGIRLIVNEKGYILKGLNVIIHDDEQLREINYTFLGHDYYTDVITFDLSDEENEISGEVYLSSTRINENAQFHGIPVLDELLRVVNHGVLHLVGFSDKDEYQKRFMRQEENYYLEKLKKD
jgi:probable rRNA maturation factor